MNINPAQYHRSSKKWQELIGKMGVVRGTTTITVAPKELEAFLPYQLLLVELREENTEKKFVDLNIKPKKIEIMGNARTEFKIGEKIILELKKIANPNNSSVIPYGIKAGKL